MTPANIRCLLLVAALALTTACDSGRILTHGDVDVPAIQVTDGLSPMGADGRGRINVPLPRWTCADKQRILLTDESGGRHCVKF
jgi:hypothetical protein